jgi:multiple antibiotic resistance protein
MNFELALAFGKSFLFVFAALLPILNPAATAPIFLGLTEGATPRTRAMLARRIARKNVEGHGGSLVAGAAPGGGASFRIVLPAWEQPATG